MDRKNIDQDHLTITGAHKKLTISPQELQVEDDVVVIVTQAYGPRGDNLIGISDESFDGYPALTLKLRANGREGLVHLSPFHGDRRKRGMIDIPVDCKCELICPISGVPLDRIGKVSADSDADYYALYLTPKLSQSDVIAISDVWGDYHSRIVDQFELISTWANHEDDGEEA